MVEGVFLYQKIFRLLKNDHIKVINNKKNFKHLLKENLINKEGIIKNTIQSYKQAIDKYKIFAIYSYSNGNRLSLRKLNKKISLFQLSKLPHFKKLKNNNQSKIFNLYSKNLVKDEKIPLKGREIIFPGLFFSKIKNFSKTKNTLYKSTQKQKGYISILSNSYLDKVLKNKSIDYRNQNLKFENKEKNFPNKGMENTYIPFEGENVLEKIKKKEKTLSKNLTSFSTIGFYAQGNSIPIEKVISKKSITKIYKIDYRASSKVFKFKIPLDENLVLKIRYVRNKFFAKISGENINITPLIQNIQVLAQQIANLGFSKTVISLYTATNGGKGFNSQRDSQNGNNKHKNVEKPFKSTSKTDINTSNFRKFL